VSLLRRRPSTGPVLHAGASGETTRRNSVRKCIIPATARRALFKFPRQAQDESSSCRISIFAPRTADPLGLPPPRKLREPLVPGLGADKETAKPFQGEVSHSSTEPWKGRGTSSVEVEEGTEEPAEVAPA